MKLCDYISYSKTSLADFAQDISVSLSAVHRYVRGERIPRTEIMSRISEVTKGAVTPNDFYGDAL